MYYADRLMELPAGVLGVALGTILLPALSKTYAGASREEYSKLLDWGLRLCLLLALPSAVALAIISEPLIVSLFQYGKFTAADTLMTQRALIAYSLGLVGIILVKILALWRLLRLGGLVGVGMLAYFAVLAALGFRVRHFSRRSVH
jgi:putative peptidoglycan lipid II flippase